MDDLVSPMSSTLALEGRFSVTLAVFVDCHDSQSRSASANTFIKVQRPSGKLWFHHSFLAGTTNADLKTSYSSTLGLSGFGLLMITDQQYCMKLSFPGPTAPSRKPRCESWPSSDRGTLGCRRHSGRGEHGLAS